MIIKLNTIARDLNHLITTACLLSVPISTVTTTNVQIFFTAFDFCFKWFCQSDGNNGTGHASSRKGVTKN
jgi:hypothetical protein